MGELTLSRDPGDRTKFTYPGVGSWRRHGGVFSRSVDVTTYDGGNWTFRANGAFKAKREAVDASGQVVGTCNQRAWYSRNCALTWLGREYQLTSDSNWRTRFVLTSGGHPLATIQGKAGGRNPVTARFVDPQLDPGLLFFASWVVLDIARQTTAAAAAG